MRSFVNVSFRPQVIETMAFYSNGKDEIQAVESMIQDNPLVGGQYFEGIPAIRALSKLYGPVPRYVGTLTWIYLYTPLADFVPKIDSDEVIVLYVGAPSTERKIRLTNLQEYQREIYDIYASLKAMFAV